MTRRMVTAIRRDSHGYVTLMANPGEDWSPRSSTDVLLDIELGSFVYYVHRPEGGADIDAAHDGGGVYLSARKHHDGPDFLLGLPDC